MLGWSERGEEEEDLLNGRNCGRYVGVVVQRYSLIGTTTSVVALRVRYSNVFVPQVAGRYLGLGMESQ